MKNLLKVTLTCELLLKAGQSHDSRLGLKQRFFIETDCIEVEKWCQNIFIIFIALWLNICNNNDQTWFFNALTFARSLAPVFNSSVRTWQKLMHENKTCLIPILWLIFTCRFSRYTRPERECVTCDIWGGVKCVSTSYMRL